MFFFPKAQKHLPRPETEMLLAAFPSHLRGLAETQVNLIRVRPDGRSGVFVSSRSRNVDGDTVVLDGETISISGRIHYDYPRPEALASVFSEYS
jgi:hypothetical protein